MPNGNADRAREDARQAAADGEFGLIETSDEDDAGEAAGTICFTPFGQIPLVLTAYGVGDYITPEIARHVAYAAAYNEAIVDRDDYPYRDLCRVRTKDDTLQYFDTVRVTIPASEVTAPPKDLFDAARRGNAQDVRRYMTRKSLDALDPVGMTALAWAVARNNKTAIDVLLSEGADPWVEGNYLRSAVYLAAALGRRATFERLAARPGKPFEAWTASFLSAAISSNALPIIKRMVAEPHETLRIDLLDRPLPGLPIVEFLLDKQPDLATPLLFKALPEYSEGRPDLVRLALSRGADPNAVERYATPLGKASVSGTPASILSTSY